jgi:AAA domain-containing protein
MFMARLAPRPASFADYRPKIGLFGASNAGKTHFLLTAPSPLIVDAESRVDAFANRGVGFKVIDPRVGPSGEMVDDVAMVANFIDTVEAIFNREPGYECGSLGIDSITAIINAMKRGMKRPGNETEWDQLTWRINTVMERIYGKAYFPVIMTAWEKNEWRSSGRERSVVGLQPNADKNFMHGFDVVAHMTVDAQSGVRSATIIKSTLQGLDRGQVIQNFTYQHIAALWGTAAPGDPSLSTKSLVELHSEVGAPGGSFGAWLDTNGFPTEKAKLTVALRTEIRRKLEARTPPAGRELIDIGGAGAPAASESGGEVRGGRDGGGDATPGGPRSPAAANGRKRNEVQGRQLQAKAAQAGIDLGPLVLGATGGETADPALCSSAETRTVLAALAKLNAA